MTKYTSLTTAAALATSVVAAIAVPPSVSASGAGAEASNTTDHRLDGVWRTDGYSSILRITGSTFELYDTTAISCVRDTTGDPGRRSPRRPRTRSSATSSPP